jgi:hypothetical protein
MYLVCRLYRKGKIVYESKKEKNTQQVPEWRRPFGCAVLLLDESVTSKVQNKESEFTVPVYASSQENNFGILHDRTPTYSAMKLTLNSVIIKKGVGIHEVPRAKGICIGLTLYNGDYKQVLQDVPEIREVAVTNRLGFSEVILPGTTRNDFFLILDEGDFTQDKTTKANNIEVDIQVS